MGCVCRLGAQQPLSDELAGVWLKMSPWNPDVNNFVPDALPGRADIDERYQPQPTMGGGAVYRELNFEGETCSCTFLGVELWISEQVWNYAITCGSVFHCILRIPFWDC